MTTPRERPAIHNMNTYGSRGRLRQALVGRILWSRRQYVEHVKDIMSMQQSYAKVSGVVETVELPQIGNGVGTPAENLTRIFNHGFTTRSARGGFALRSGALAAKQLGSALTARSEGRGKGATFNLEQPKTGPAPILRTRLSHEQA